MLPALGGCFGAVKLVWRLRARMLGPSALQSSLRADIARTLRDITRLLQLCLTHTREANLGWLLGSKHPMLPACFHGSLPATVPEQPPTVTAGAGLPPSAVVPEAVKTESSPPTIATAAPPNTAVEPMLPFAPTHSVRPSPDPPTGSARAAPASASAPVCGVVEFKEEATPINTHWQASPAQLPPVHLIDPLQGGWHAVPADSHAAPLFPGLTHAQMGEFVLLTVRLQGLLLNYRPYVPDGDWVRVCEDVTDLRSDAVGEGTRLDVISRMHRAYAFLTPQDGNVWDAVL